MAREFAVVEGAAELDAKLSALALKVQKKYLRTALRVGAKAMKPSIAQRTPVRSGLLKKNLKVRAGKRRKAGGVSVLVSFGAKWFVGKTFYAGFVVYGHRIGKRSKEVRRVDRLRRRFGPAVTAAADSRRVVPPNEFMQKGFAAGKSAAMTAIIGSLKASLAAAPRELLTGAADVGPAAE